MSEEDSDDREERSAGVDEALMDRFKTASASESAEETNSGKTNMANNTSKTAKANKANKPNERDKSDKMAKRNKAGKSDKSDKSDKAGKSDKSDKSDKAGKSDKASKTNKASKTPIDERKQVMLYLRERVADKLDLVEDEIALEWKRAFGSELERNRHIRPLVLECGMERVREMSAEEIREYLIDAEQFDDPPESDSSHS